MVASIEKALLPEEVMEMLSLKKRDGVYALLGTMMADGQTLGFKVGRLWRCDPDRLRRFQRNELTETHDARRPPASQRDLLRGVQSLLRPSVKQTVKK